jgi:hypothetical protein
LFDDFYGLKHHLRLRIILLPETNRALEPHDPRRSHPKREAHGFVFTVVTAAALIVTVVVFLVAVDGTAASVTGGISAPTSSSTLHLSGAGGEVEDEPSSSSKLCLLLGEAMEADVIVEVVGVFF